MHPIGDVDMYDKDPAPTNAADTLPHARTIATMMIDDEAVESSSVALHQLRSAVVELSTALTETLRDERSSAAACLQRAKALLLADHGSSPQPEEKNVRRGLAPWQVRRVLAHIEANLSAPIKNKDLAAIARLSTYHFNVAFRNSVGDPPHAYIIRRRIERAQGLMLSTNRALSDIAAECGLADQAHFTRLFGKIVGESPAAWRRARMNPA
jgi:transcriptional regulator GlxA family with amidase domain